MWATNVKENLITLLPVVTTTHIQSPYSWEMNNMCTQPFVSFPYVNLIVTLRSLNSKYQAASNKWKDCISPCKILSTLVPSLMLDQ